MRNVIFVLAAVVWISVVFCHDDVLADTDDLVLTVGLKEEYLDNIFFDANNEVDDYITTLSAGVELRKRTERLKAGLQGLLDGVMYVDNDDLNNLDQFYRGYVKYLVSERLVVAGEASYKDDSRADRDVAQTGLVLGTNVRKTQRYKGKAGYDVSELSNVSLGYIYRKEDYDKQQYDDYDTHSTTAQWKYNLGYWLTGSKSRVTLQYSRYNYRFSETDNYSATLGIEKELSELYSFYVDLGGRYSEYRFFDGNDLNVNNDGAGGVLKAGLKYKGEYTNTRLSVLHDIAPASGRGRTLERTAFIGSVRYRFTEKFSSGLRGGYYWNRGDVSADPFDERTLRIVPELIYRFTNDMKATASYTYTMIDSDKNNQDKDRNDFFIRFVFKHTFFE